MRARLCSLLAGLLVVFLVSPAFAVPTVANAGFESGLAGSWSLWKGSGGNNDPLERDWYPSGQPDGVWCLAVKGIGSGGKGAYQHVTGDWVVGRDYRISVHVKNLSNTNMNYSVGYQLGNPGAGGGPSAVYGTTVVHPGSWTQASVDLTYSGSAGVTIYLRVVNDGHSERAGFDLVEIEDLGASGPTPTFTPTQTGPQPTATPTPGSPSQPPVLSNPGFEGGLSGNWTLWKGSGGNSDPLERDWYGSGQPDGVWCLAVKGIGTGGKGAYQYVNNNWVAGRNYRISVWARNLSNTNINYSVGYRLGNTGSGGGPGATYGTTAVHPSSWTQATVELTYSGSAGVTVYLRAVNDGHSERAGFDLVEIEDLGGGSPPPTDTPLPPTPTPGGPTSTPLPTPGGTIQLTAEEYYERAKGMWFGQLIGVWMGAQYEFDYVDQPAPYDTVPTPSTMQASNVDDDVSFEWTYMYLVQRYGWWMGYPEAEESWERHFRRLLAGANEQARGLLSAGYHPPDTGSRQYNSYWFFIDAQIESEVWGLMGAGMGAVTKDQSNIWAHVSNDGGACDGATFYSVMNAYAMVEQDVEKVLRAAMTHYPTNSEIYGLADYVIQLYHQYPNDWRTVRQILRDYTWNANNFEGYVAEHRGIFWATNFASVLTAIMYGQGDFHDTLQLAIVQGYDADCNAATAAGFAGIINGFHGIPPGYRDNYTDHFHNWNLMVEQMPLVDSLSSMAAQAQRMFEYVLQIHGGQVTGTAWNKVYDIPSDWPASVPRTVPGAPTPTYTPVPGPPTILNGNMEQQAFGGVWLPEYWHPFGGEKFERQWHPGTSSYMAGVSEFRGEFRPYAGIFQPVYGAVPGHRYQVDADVWLTNGDLRASAGIDPRGWWDYENAPYGTEISASGHVSHSVVAQDSRLAVFIRVRSVSSGFNTGWGHIDNVTLTDLGPD